MDETGITTNRKFKVVVPEGMFPLVPHERQEIHLTGVATFSAGGRLFRPMVILARLRNLPPELQCLSCDAHFFATQSGWMTKDVFEVFAVNLAHEVQLWRRELPQELRNKRVLLVLDGHGSRKTARGMLYLQKFGNCSAGGRLFRPMVILPRLRNLPAELQCLSSEAHFFATQSGWMTKGAFEVFAVNLAHEVNLWKRNLPQDLRNKRVLLLLDGHGSDVDVLFDAEKARFRRTRARDTPHVHFTP